MPSTLIVSPRPSGETSISQYGSVGELHVALYLRGAAHTVNGQKAMHIQCTDGALAGETTIFVDIHDPRDTPELTSYAAGERRSAEQSYRC